MPSGTRGGVRGFRPPRCESRRHPRVASSDVARLHRVKKILSLAGSVLVSSGLGWAGSEYGVMTGFLLGTVGTGLGMYAGYRLAAHLEG
jgi:hypothetical protein